MSGLLRFDSHSRCWMIVRVQRHLQMVMIDAAKRVPPSRGVAERLILHDRRVGEQIPLATLGLEAVVSARPDALKVGDFAFPVARSAARAVALVLGALRLRAEKC